MKRRRVEFTPPMRFTRRGLGLAHQAPDGKLCLKVDVGWRSWSGVWLNTSRWCVWVYFRRIPK